MKYAIIDLGTNTFNLLITEVKDGTYRIVEESKCYVRLGHGGINSGKITDEAFQRGLDGLRTHVDTINKHDVESVHCFATAAIRSATNGEEFVSLVKKELGLVINVIGGDKEAELIYDGVKQVYPMNDENVVILDIGGGSNEFIIANKGGVLWKHSFNLGVARLLDRFKPSNPISVDEISVIEDYLRPELELLFDAMKQFSAEILVGSSGSFDTIAKMIAAEYHPFFDITKTSSFEVNLHHFKRLHEKYLVSTLEERKAMKGMDLNRVEMIVLASIFINFIIREFSIKKIFQCGFALKEGAIFQVIHKQLER